MKEEGRRLHAPAGAISRRRDVRTRNIAIPIQLQEGPSWRYNRRWRPRCECGSGRPTLSHIEFGDRKRKVCGDCARGVWFEELNLWELRLAAFRAEIVAGRGS